MLEWWECYYIIEDAKQNDNLQETFEAYIDINEIKNNQLVIHYNRSLFEEKAPIRCHNLANIVRRYVREVAEALGEDMNECEKRLKLAMFAVLFSHAPLHFNNADFAVPILIGESLRYLEPYLA